MKIQFESNNLVIFESALFRTTSSLILAEEHIILVDPNWFPVELQFIQDYISKQESKKEKYLFFTHSDYDHIIGYNFFQGFKTIASRNFVNQKTKQRILEKIATIDDDNYTKRAYKVQFPYIDIVIEENQDLLHLGNKAYQIGYLQGHNDDSIYLLDSEHRVLLVGDYLSNIEFPYLYYSYAAYVKSLKLLSSIIESGKVELLVPGHGDYANTLVEMKKRVEDSYDYLRKLKEHCDGKSIFDFDEYVKDFYFPIVMRKFHEKNVDLMIKELSLS